MPVQGEDRLARVLQKVGSSRFRVGNNEHKDHVSPRFDP